MATLPQYTAAISGGTLTLDLHGEGDSTHIVTLNANISAGGISFTNPPVSGFVRVRIIFSQITPSGTLYDIPVTAWAGAYTITWDSDYAIWQNSTPSIIQIQSWDQMATMRATMNAQAGAVVLAVTAIPASPDVDTIYVKYSE
jgi:hypothetical protein